MLSRTIARSPQRLHVIEDWWRRQPGNWVCLSVKLTNEKPQDFFVDRHHIDVADFIAEHSHGLSDLHYYFCPHKFEHRRRLKINAIDPRGLYADLDRVDPRKLGRLKPTIAIETSPSRYAGLWQTDTQASDELNKRLTYHLGADKSGWARSC